MSASLSAGLVWIAINDNNAEDRDGSVRAADSIASYLTTSLLADLFEVDPGEIGRVVAILRRDEDAGCSIHQTRAAFVLRGVRRGAHRLTDDP